ncbi:MAG: hypothetical protein HYY16_07720 [Planctomycetes bacterium]|nr:hypothetical protein [Planctomycetota bacterium]
MHTLAGKIRVNPQNPRNPCYRLAFLWAAPLLAGTIATQSGCDDATADAQAEQPIAFSHEKHVGYFSSGAHREEMVRMHLEAMGETEAPKAIVQGQCRKCHAEMEGLTRCVGCHGLFEDERQRGRKVGVEETLLERKDIRACVGCHGQAWTGSRATIPSNAVCRSCHNPRPRTNSPEERRLMEYLGSGKDVPWVQIHTTSPAVYFSHSAHVRYGKMGCVTCHEDMSRRSEPPASARVYSMNACLKCHKEKHASTDCIACHK